MLKRSLASLIMALAMAATAQAVELSQIDRAIGREPHYQKQPKYCLLVFGPAATTRVWLVADGNVLYVDRNANDDLTDPDERFVSSSTGPFPWISVPDITAAAGAPKRLAVSLLANDQLRMNLSQGKWGQQFVGWGKAGMPTLATEPGKAPVIHFEGPLTLGSYGLLPELSGGHDRAFSLQVMIGTSGIGAGAFAGVRRVGSLETDIELEYTSQAGETCFASTKQTLLSRCGFFLVSDAISLPADVASGLLRATLSPTHHLESTLTPATLEIRTK
jgi:hypothetical protein